MLYAILCYHDEDTVGSWTKEQDAAVMTKLAVVQDKLTKQGRLGPVARLLPTTAATTSQRAGPGHAGASPSTGAGAPTARVSCTPVVALTGASLPPPPSGRAPEAPH